MFLQKLYEHIVMLFTDISDTNDEDVTETKREVRKRGNSFALKKNMKGETQLHVVSFDNALF